MCGGVVSLTLVGRFDRSAFTSVGIPGFETQFAAQSDWSVVGRWAEIGQIVKSLTVTFFVNVAQRFSRFESDVCRSLGLQSFGERCGIGMAYKEHFASCIVGIAIGSLRQ